MPSDPSVIHHLKEGAGYVEGYCATRVGEQMGNFLTRHEVSAEDARMLAESFEAYFEQVFVLEGMRVEPAFQGRGLGKALLEGAIDAADAPVTVLACDGGEEQREGFSLERFYENQGFETFFRALDGAAVMASPEDAALALREHFDRLQARRTRESAPSATP